MIPRRALLATPLALAACRHAMPASIAHPLARQQAPAFEGETADGFVAVPSASPRTRVMLVDFWASWCSSCVATFAFYEGLSRELHPSGLTIVAVNIDDDPSAALEAPTRYRLSFPVVHDKHQRIAASYRVSQVPTSFVIDADGLVRWVGHDPRAARDAALAVLGR